MGHQLKRLLGNDHPLFVSNMFALERAVGNDGVAAAAHQRHILKMPVA